MSTDNTQVVMRMRSWEQDLRPNGARSDYHRKVLIDACDVLAALEAENERLKDELGEALVNEWGISEIGGVMRRKYPTPEAYVDAVIGDTQ